MVGEWNAVIVDKIGIFNPSQGWWVIDYNGSTIWDGAVTDRYLKWRQPGDVPLAVPLAARW